MKNKIFLLLLVFAFVVAYVGGVVKTLFLSILGITLTLIVAILTVLGK